MATLTLPIPPANLNPPDSTTTTLTYKSPPPFLNTFTPTFTLSKPLFTASSSSNTDRINESFPEPDLQQQFPEPDGPQPKPEDPEPEMELESNVVDGIEVEIEKVSKNRRRIRSKVAIEASLETVWGILTDYERLAEVIPGLVVSQVLDKRKNFARLLQIGQQNLAFGLKFSAKGVVDCYEQDFEVLPYGVKRDIEFKMIEGDFEVFEGKWSIEQYEQSDFVSGQQYDTTLLYTVEVEPKMWLPVQLIEGRISKEIQINLVSIREEARKISDSVSAS